MAMTPRAPGAPDTPPTPPTPPTSPTPATPGRAFRRAVATVTVGLLVIAGFVAGFLVAGARDGQEPPLRLSAAGLDSGLSCDRLHAWYVEHGVDQVTAWGWQGPAYPVMAENSTAAGAPGTTLDTQTASSTGTNVQEAGVDEPDIVKTTGDLLVRIGGGVLKTDDVGGAEPRRLGVAPLDRIGDPQLLLSGDRAVVIGAEVEDPAAGAPPFPPPPRTWVRTYDLTDPSEPTLVDSRLYDGSLVAARQVGSVIRLVLDGGPPSLDFERPSTSVSEQEALAHNRQVVRDSSTSDWLPQVTTYDTATQGPFGSPTAHGLVDCSDVAVPETFNGLSTLTVVGLDPADPTATDTTAVATASDTAYLSPSHLYVATSTRSPGWQDVGPMPMEAMTAPGPTRIYGFDLSGISARYVGMGSVDGTVAGSASMDEHDGVLRVAASAPGSTSVVLLRPASGRLLDVGHLDGLGRGQQLKSVRWFDGLAVLVTFRQTDPFYVVDVADPTDPQVIGALHLPGWSSYLHPVGPHLVLGLGRTAPRDVAIEPFQPVPTMPTLPPMPVPTPPQPKSTDPLFPQPSAGVATSSLVPTEAPDRPRLMGAAQRAKATLFDIADPAAPRAVATVSYPAGSIPMAEIDPHQVTWLPEQQTLLTVVSTGGPWSRSLPRATRPVPPAWVSVLTVRDDGLSNRLVPVTKTDDVREVRTLPLADGRVLVVAGDSVSFLAV